MDFRDQLELIDELINVIINKTRTDKVDYSARETLRDEYRDLREKNKSNSYQSILDFADDVLSIAVRYDIQYEATKSDQNRELRDITEEVSNEISDDVDLAKTCVDCVFNHHLKERGDHDNGFVKVCRQPHALVWAKIDGFDHWPAKVLNADPERRLVELFWFGTHTITADVPYDKCRPMTRRYLWSMDNLKEETKLKKSIKECKLYVKNLMVIYPSIAIYGNGKQAYDGQMYIGQDIEDDTMKKERY